MSASTGNLYIDGAWRAGRGDAFESVNPASGALVWQGNAASAADVDIAYQAATAAFPKWAATPYTERARIVTRFTERIAKDKDALGNLIAQETGKALWDAMTEAVAMAGKAAISMKAYEARTGAARAETAFGQTVLRHKPHGVMAVMGPYNFPGHLPNGHVIPALLAGDVVVFKPSELTPAVGEVMVKAWDEAGLPPGVLNLVQGARDTGVALLDHPKVNGVLFTGSAKTGALIHEKFGGRPDVILALEMGGNAPLIVWPGAENTMDPEAVARMVAHSAFITSGQRCTCARRLILPHGDLGDEILEALGALIDAMVIGAPHQDPPPFMGPVISEGAANAVLAAQAGLLRAGARALKSVERLDDGPAFLKPGFIDVTGLDAPDEEVFGPLLQVYRVTSFDHALARANATRFGLAAGLICPDPALWDRFVLEIRAGVVNWNRPTTGAASSLPFGGPGASGNHRPSAYYAADYCAWPMASQEASSIERMMAPGWPE